VTRTFQYKQQQERALGLLFGYRSFTETSSMATPGSAPQEFDLVTIGAGKLLSSAAVLQASLCPPLVAPHNVHAKVHMLLAIASMKAKALITPVIHAEVLALCLMQAAAACVPAGLLRSTTMQRWLA
jgi:hypothetical protein